MENKRFQAFKISLSLLFIGSLTACNIDSNARPTAYDQNITTNKDISINITLDADDDDGTIHGYTVRNEPTNGTLSGTAPFLNYTPNTGYVGADEIRYTATDNQGSVSNTAVISISVVEVDVSNTPEANAQSLTTNEDLPLNIILSGTDTDGTVASYTIVTGPTNGSLTGTIPSITYVPAANYFGSDSFTFTVTDNDGLTSSEAIISITVSSVNDTPTATDQSVATDKNLAKAITLSGADLDGTITSYAIATGPANGVLTGTIPNLTYTPTTNYTGADSFTFTVTDNNGATSAVATVSLTINDVISPPVATAQSVSTNEDTDLDITLSGTDSDGTITSYTVETSPSNGVLTGTVPDLTYTPAADYFGSDSFTFTVTDNDGATSNEETITITVDAVNDPPTATTDNLTATGNTQKTFNAASGVLSNDSDIDSPTIDLTVTAGVIATTNGGSVNMSSDGSFVYTPPAGYSSDSFSYTLNDNDSVDPQSSVGSTSITLSDMVWYVDDSAAGGGDGTSASPFNTLAAGVAASSSLETVFVYAGNYTGGVTLPSEVRLIGEGEGLTVEGLTVAAGTNPVISGSGGATSSTITLSGDNIVSGLTITGNARGIYADSISTVDIENVTITNTGGISIEMVDIGGAFNLVNSSISNSTYAVDGLDINNAGVASGTLYVMIENSSFTGNATAFGMQNAIDIITSTGSNMYATIRGNSITYPYFDGIELTVNGSSNSDSISIGDGVTGNTFTGIGAIVMDLKSADNTNASFSILGNTVDGNSLSVDDGINFIIQDGAIVDATISNNTFTDIGDDTTFDDTLSDDMVMRLVLGDVSSAGTDVILTIENNTLSNNNARGVVIDAYGGLTASASVNNNTFNGHLGNNGLDVLTASSGTTICLGVSGNSDSTSSDSIVLEETADGSALNVSAYASEAAMESANNGMNVTVTGSVAFGVCTP